jgi:Protein of unknown function (DUF3352)
MKKIGIAVAAALVVVSGGAYFGVRAFMAPLEDRAVQLVPSDASVYVSAFINPSNGQKSSLRDLLGKFESAPSSDELGDEIADLLDDALEGSGLTYRRDVEPWLGRQAAVFVTDFTFMGRDEPVAAALVETDDTDATLRAVERAADFTDMEGETRTYKGIEYSFYADERAAVGIVEEFLVAGTENALKAVVDVSAGADSLASDGRYQRAVEPLADDYIGSFYFDVDQLVEQALAQVDPPEMEGFESLPLDVVGPVAGVGGVTEESAWFEASAEIRDATLRASLAPTELLPAMPADAWLAAGGSDVGRSFEWFFDIIDESGVPQEEFAAAQEQFESEFGLDLRDDVLAWMGDIGLFVQGTNPFGIGAALTIETTDPVASRKVVDAIGNYAARRGVSVAPMDLGAYTGFEVRFPGISQPLRVLAGPKVIAAFGVKAANDAIEADETLEEDNEVFDRAEDDLGEGFDPSTFVDLDSVEELADSLFPPGGEFDRPAPWLGPLSHFVAGTKVDGDVVIQKLVIGVE